MQHVGIKLRAPFINGLIVDEWDCPGIVIPTHRGTTAMNGARKVSRTFNKGQSAC
jgi:hypothetical protein